MKGVIFGLLILTALGCTAVQQARTDASICLQDPVCREEAVSQAIKAKEISVAISGASPIPLSTNVVGGIAYGAVLIFALWKKGKKKREGVV